MHTATRPVSSARQRWRWTYVIFAVLLLAAPMLAMQFTSEVQWTFGDFAVFGAMLAVLGLLLEGAIRLGGSILSRAMLAGVAVAAFLFVWAQLAVGIL